MSDAKNPTKQQRRMAVKADLLDALSSRCRSWDVHPSHALTSDEVAEVFDETADQLYRWAVRITPPGEILLDEDGDR